MKIKIITNKHTQKKNGMNISVHIKPLKWYVLLLLYINIYYKYYGYVLQNKNQTTQAIASG